MTAAGSSPETPATAGPRSVAGAMIQGALSFGVVAVLAYSIWAFRLIRGQVPMYAAIALVFICLGGFALGRLVPLPGAWKRFPLLFGAGFAIYAIAWCAFWWALGGRHYADFWGGLVGLAGMTWFLQRALGQKTGFWRAYAVLLVAYNVGYYAGGKLKYAVGGSNGAMLWGVCYGLGFGAGLAYLLHHCRPAARPA